LNNDSNNINLERTKLMKRLKFLTVILLTQLAMAQNVFAKNNRDLHSFQDKDLHPYQVDMETTVSDNPVSSFNVETDNISEKGSYNLFNPTPGDQMREISTDRPDKTESAYTVDAGHFQFETDMVTFVNNTENSENDRDIGINVINLKAGLTNNIDLQVVVPSYIISSVEKGGKNNSLGGFGDITTRLKVNVFGNEDDFALAIMPYIKLPTNTNNLGNKYFEGGVIIPTAYPVPFGFSFGSTVSWNYLRNDEDTGYINRLVTSITLGHQIIGELSGYAEIFSDKNLQAPDWVVTADAGLTYGITDKIVLDGGINIGITKEADDFNPFLGLSVLF
jgi:hypothetical protein